MGVTFKGVEPPKPMIGPNYAAHLGSKHIKPVTAITSSVKSTKGEPMPEGVNQSETVHHGVLTDGHSITVEASRTINLGDFNSARIGVSITVPTDKASLNEAYEWASSWCSEKIEKELAGTKS